MPQRTQYDPSRAADPLNSEPARYYRKIIKITARDSPNVRLALEEQRRGLEPSGKIIVPGVLPWDEYVKRLETWDEVRRSIGLDAEFYEGAELLLFPPAWLNRANRVAEMLELNETVRRAAAIGIDPAEGGDKTAMVAVDSYGVIEIVSKKTPDTSIIRHEALAFMRKHDVPPDKVVFDQGGGGKQHADYLREMGFNVRTVAFGASIVRAASNRRAYLVAEEEDLREEKYIYKNRRAEMYGILSSLLDPSLFAEQGRVGFGIPEKYRILRSELAPIPKKYDREGRLDLPPKRKKDAKDNVKTLEEIIGHSPDEADALALAVYGMMSLKKRIVVGAY
jgi:hypothetical protein